MIAMVRQVTKSSLLQLIDGEVDGFSLQHIVTDYVTSANNRTEKANNTGLFQGFWDSLRWAEHLEEYLKHDYTLKEVKCHWINLSS